MLFLFSLSSAYAQTNFHLRVMSANITSGNGQSYEAEGIRIFQGLKPDVVAIQEFRYNSSSTDTQLRQLVDTAFGTNYSYYCETGYNIPNGIVSRWPIVDAGSVDDPTVNDRGIAWAKIQLPGTNLLCVVSVHLYGSGTASDRNTEAMVVTNLIATNFPPGAWVVVGGDFNTGSRTEACVTTLKNILSDSPVPTDVVGDDDTNEPRNKPYDYVLPSFSLTNYLTAVSIGAQNFNNGLVFDSTNYTPLVDVSPIQFGDSHVNGMQHMAVIKDFIVGGGPITNAPSISVQPLSQNILVSNSVTFSVTASGTAPLSYQWYFNTTNAIQDATTNTYTITSVQLTNAGNFSVIITNIAGSVTSSVATLAVITNISPIIAQWNFNSLVADTNATTGVTTPSAGSGTASLVGGATINGSGFAAGDATLDPVGTNDNSGWNTTSYPTQGTGNKTRGVQFAVSTGGRQNITVSWSSQASNTGSRYGRLQYTTNGTDFIDSPTVFTNAAGTFSSKTNNFTGISSVNDNPNFAIRLVAEFEATAIGTVNSNYVAANASSSYASSGTMRFDMVTVYGSPIASGNPATNAVLGMPQFSSNQFQFTVTGSAGSNYVVQVSTNLSDANWISVFTNVSPFTFVETNADLSAQKFYRAIVLP